MNKEYVIRHQIEKYGCSVELIDGDWISVPFKALISPLWRKKTSNFEAGFTELGTNLSEYYMYIGSANHNITDLSESAVLRFSDEVFEFKHRDRVTVNDEVLYYMGILRKLKGDSENDD